MISVIVKDFKEFFRDKANLFFILLFPSLLVFLLGNLLAFMDESDNAVGTMNVQYSVETTDPSGLAAIGAFLDGIGDNADFSIQKTDEIGQAKQLVSEGKLDAAVVFEQPLGVSIYEGSDTIKNRALRSMFTAFSKTANAAATVQEKAPQALAGLGAEEGSEFVQQKDLGVNRTMLDYYAVAMTVMILFMGGMGGALSLQGERRDGTLNRLLVSPKNRAVLYVQKVLGSIPQAFLQVTVVMLSSTLLFGAHYAAAWQHNLLLFAMFFVCGLAVIAVCALVGIFIKVNAMVLMMPVFWGLMFLSGTFSKEIYVEGLTNRSPLYLIQNAAFDLTVFGRTQRVWVVLAVAAAVFLLALAVGTVLFLRKGEER